MNPIAVRLMESGAGGSQIRAHITDAVVGKTLVYADHIFVQLGIPAAVVAPEEPGLSVIIDEYSGIVKPQSPGMSGLPRASVQGPSGRSATATPIPCRCLVVSSAATYQYYLPLRSMACEAQALSPCLAHLKLAVESTIP